jgi:NAD(P)H-dependent FMN reductase
MDMTGQEEYPAKIGIIICSTRTPRVCPQITQFVLDTIQSTKHQDTTIPTPDIIDLAEWNLPLFDESSIPSQIKDPSQYDHDHTRAWSTEITRYHAFIFVVPQYNWGYPAVIKNAIDYLYHEWSGKPAFVVSYGGHGGGKCNRQLREVLRGVRMEIIERNVELAFPGRSVLERAAKGEDIGLANGSGSGGKLGFWEDERRGIVDAYRELLQVLSGPV